MSSIDFVGVGFLLEWIERHFTRAEVIKTVSAHFETSSRCLCAIAVTLVVAFADVKLLTVGCCEYELVEDWHQ